MFSSLLEEHRARLKDERERARYAYDARYQAIGRIGLPQVREHRRKRLDAEHQARMAALDDAEASVPDLNAVLMLRIGPEAGAWKDAEARVRKAQHVPSQWERKQPWNEEGRDK